ncbi:MAG: type I restriction enzyme HsdR N-terminal domain-containing protein [bacterium]|nr:type I restriction enzyme HsdR N-terminal domain-containing protein [bacterium]
MQLNFKDYNFTIKNENGNALIFDIIRKKYVSLTPEEWVRQHVVRHLIEEKGYSAGLIAIEKSLKYNGLHKRFDLYVANNDGSPQILIECKAPNVKLTEATLKQAGIYQKHLKAKFVLLTNGLQHIYLSLQSETLVVIDDLPNFK